MVLMIQSSRVCIYTWVTELLGTGNYKYEDNFPTVQFARQHSLPKEVLGAVLVNRETAVALLVYFDR